MRARRRALVAYGCFVIACLIPGWLLRDIVCAELQLRGAPSPTSRRAPRKLGPIGTWYLCQILVGKVDGVFPPSLAPKSKARLALEMLTIDLGGSTPILSPRQHRASALLWQYDDLEVIDARIHAIPPIAQEEAMWDSVGWDWRGSSDKVGACIDAMSDEDLRGALKASAPYPDVQCFPYHGDRRGWFLWVLWSVRPDRCEEVITRILRETDDQTLADLVSDDGYRDHGNYTWYNLLTFDACAEGNHERRMRAMRAGLANPNEPIRRWCKEALSAPPRKDGGHRYGE